MTLEDAMLSELLGRLHEGHTESAGFTDDVGMLPQPSSGHRLVVSTDSVIDGVHVIGDEPSAQIAVKLLRRGLSDLAAKAAKPICYTLNLALDVTWLREHSNFGWLDGLVEGLLTEQRARGIFVLGGDTTALPVGSGFRFSLGVTVFGELIAHRWSQRAAGRAGDLLFVTGAIGAARRGLSLYRGGGGGEVAAQAARGARARYRVPPSRIDLMQEIARRTEISSSVDISDGLLTDVDRICRASGLEAELDLRLIAHHPSIADDVAAHWLRAADVDILLAAAKHGQGDGSGVGHVGAEGAPQEQSLVAQAQGRLSRLCSLFDGGDDYEVVFACPPDTKVAAVENIGKVTPYGDDNYPAQVRCVGRLVAPTRGDNFVGKAAPSSIHLTFSKHPTTLASLVAEQRGDGETTSTAPVSGTRLVRAVLAGYDHYG